MAPRGQGALVDVCNSKAHPQCPCGPGQAAGPRLGPGRAAAQGQLDTEALEAPGLGWRRRSSHQKGKRAQRGEGTSLGHTASSRGEGGGMGAEQRGQAGLQKDPRSGALPPVRSLCWPGPGAQHYERADGDPPGTATSPAASKPALGQAL